MVTFDITTGAKAAQQVIEKKEEEKTIIKPEPPKKKKLNKADFMFKSQKDQVLIKKPGDINGIDFMIKDLENCTVYLLDHIAQL